MRRLNSTIDKSNKIWYNIYSQEDRSGRVPRLKKFSKSFAKPLDKPHIMWYNNSVPRGTERKYLTYEHFGFRHGNNERK